MMRSCRLSASLTIFKQYSAYLSYSSALAILSPLPHSPSVVLASGVEVSLFKIEHVLKLGHLAPTELSAADALGQARCYYPPPGSPSPFGSPLDRRAVRQPDLCDPEIIDALHEDFERVQLHGFGEVAICVELIGFRDVCFRVGSGEDHCWDRFQAVVTLDLSQDLATIDFRKVQVQQDDVRPRGVSLRPLAPQKGHGLQTVGRHMQAHRPVDLAKGFLRQADVSRTVFDQENLYWRAVVVGGC